jgi:hypothetical protein
MMAHASESLSREERFVRTSNRLVLAYVTAFGAWQLADLIGRWWFVGRPRIVLVALSLTAWATSTVLLLVLTGRRRTMKQDPAIRAVVEDERAQGVRMRAYRTAYWCAIGTAALLGIPAEANVLPAFAATRLVVVIGIAAFIIASIVLDRG